MSPEDTDIIEVALDTLVALERLRVALASRDHSLRLLHAQLRWEASRKSCCQTFLPLARDYSNFIRQQARWVPAAPVEVTSKNDDGKSFSAFESAKALVKSDKASPRPQEDHCLASSEGPFPSLKVLIERSEELFARSATFASNLIPSSSEALDAIIELQQAPEAFLDEQDCIENLALALESRVIFVRDILAQWRAADELCHRVRDLHYSSKRLLNEVITARASPSSTKLSAHLEQTTESLVTNLEDLCDSGPARLYLQNPQKAASCLRFSPRHFLPMPRHEAFPDQPEHDGKALSALHRELTAAVKRLRQAVLASKSFLRGQKAYENAQLRLRQLNENARRSRQIRDSILIEYFGSTGTVETFSKNDIARAMLAQSYESWSTVISKSKVLVASKGAFQDLIAASVRTREGLTRDMTTCLDCGLNLTALHDEADFETQEWQKVSQDTRSTLDELTTLLDMLSRLSDVNALVLDNYSLLKARAEEIYRHIVELCFVPSQIGKTPSLESSTQMEQPPKALLGELRARLGELKLHILSEIASERLEEVEISLLNCLTLADDIDRLQGWAAELCRQRESIENFNCRFAALVTETVNLRRELKDTASNEDDIQSSAPLHKLIQRLNLLKNRIHCFKELQSSALYLVGPPPCLQVWLDKSLQCPDEEVRQVSYSWCLCLDRSVADIEDLLQQCEVSANPNSYPVQNSERVKMAEEELPFDAVQTSVSCNDGKEAESVRPPESLSSDSAVAAAKPNSLCIELAAPTLDSSAAEASSIQQRHTATHMSRPVGPDVQASQQMKETLAIAIHAYEIELKRREKSFNRVLNSPNSRRLPPQAFVVELTNRKMEAEDAFDNRNRAVTRSVARLMEASPSSQSDSTNIEVLERVQLQQSQLQMQAHQLLKTFTASIESEQGAYSGGEIARTPIRDHHLIPPRTASDSSAQVSAIGFSVTPPSLSFSSTLPKEVLDDIEKLTKSLRSDPVERQTQLDGLAQAKALLELPSSGEAEKASLQVEQDKHCLDGICAQHSYDPRTTTLSRLFKSRLVKVDRFTSLAKFGDRATEIESSLASFLSLLDSASDLGPRQMSPSPSIPSFEEESYPATEFALGSSTYETRLGLVNVASKDTIRERLTELELLIEATTSLATPVFQDLRVRKRMEQIQRSFVDMAEMAQDIIDPSSKRSASVLSCCTTEGSLSTLSTPLLESEALPDLTLSRIEPNDSLLMTPSRIPRAERPIPLSRHNTLRQRTTSLTAPRRVPHGATTPSKIPTASLGAHSPIARHFRASSGGETSIFNPKIIETVRDRPRLSSIAQSPASTPPGFARPTVASMYRNAGSSLPSTQTTPLSKSSLRGLNERGAPSTPQNLDQIAASGHRPNCYRPNPRNKLDVAVGKVVNRLPMQVSMVHASKAPHASSKGYDGWKDDSGRYWVGHPDPKLCFCRILRSRTIMVRVGGGWQELTRYLLAHYRDSLSMSTTLTFGPSNAVAEGHQSAVTGAPMLGIQSSPAAGTATPGDRQFRAAQTYSAATSDLPWITSTSLRDHTQVTSMSPIASGSPARMARSPSQSMTSVADISSPIFLNADGSPQQQRLMSTHTLTPTTHRARTMSLQGKNLQSPNEHFRRSKSPLLPSPNPNCPPPGVAAADDSLFMVRERAPGLNAVDATQRYPDNGVQEGTISNRSLPQGEQQYAFQLKAPLFVLTEHARKSPRSVSAAVRPTEEPSDGTISGDEDGKPGDATRTDVKIDEVLLSPTRPAVRNDPRTSLSTGCVLTPRGRASSHGVLKSSRQTRQTAEAKLLPLFFKKENAAR